MFPLTRTMRQAITTVVLVVFTVIPTLFVAYTAWRVNRPGHIRDVEIEWATPILAAISRTARQMMGY